MPAYFGASSLALALRPGFTTAYAHELAAGDFNGDGRTDLVLGYFLYPLEDRAVPIRLLSGDGAGGFFDATAAVFGADAPVTVHARQIVAGDLNKDGRLDLFFADHGYDAAPFPGARNALVLSAGQTGLVNATQRLPNLADFSHSAAFGDVDGDSDIDIFVGNQGTGDEAPYFLLNDGAANFTRSSGALPASLFHGHPGFPSTLLFDADKDGDLDLLLAPWDPRLASMRVLANDGAGRFETTLSTIDIPARGASENVIDSRALDLNGDGALDLVVTTVVDFFQVGAVRFLINDGQGRFVDETAQRLPVKAVEGWNTRVQFVDINGDGHLDMLLSNGAKAPLFLNDGSGRFLQLPAGVVPGNEFDKYVAADFNGDGRTDLIAWRGVFDGAERLAVHLAADLGALHQGDAAANGLMGDADAERLEGLGGDDVVFGGQGADTLVGGEGADTLVGGGGADQLEGGGGADEARFAGARAHYQITVSGGAWQVTDLRSGAPEASDILVGVELLRFADRSLALPQAAVASAVAQVLRQDALSGGGGALAADLTAKLNTGGASLDAAIAELVKAADATTSVATLSYQFFTGKIPSQGGIDYLVSPTGPNPNNLNSAYYQSFNLENRYINFAVNLGREGEGRAKFEAEYGSLTLVQATKKAYEEIFGLAPTDAKVAALLSGGRDLYFEAYGRDGLNGLGTKAAMVGWLLAEAEKADIGQYARANAAFLTDLADGAAFAVDLIAAYGRPEYDYGG